MWILQCKIVCAWNVYIRLHDKCSQRGINRLEEKRKVRKGIGKVIMRPTESLWVSYWGMRGKGYVRMIVTIKVNSESWAPGDSHILCNDSIYYLYAYEGVEKERKIHDDEIKAKELWDQIVEWDSSSMMESSTLTSYFLRINMFLVFFVFLWFSFLENIFILFLVLMKSYV